MKVLITTELYLPFRCGVTSAIEAERCALEKKGDEVRILAISSNKESYYDPSLKTWYIAQTLPQFYKDSYASLNVHDKILSSLYEWRPDVIHSQTEFFSFRFASHIANRLNIPLVHTCHTDFVSYTVHFTRFTKAWNYFTSLLVPLFIRRADRIICSTDKIYSLISSYKVKQPIDRVLIGVDLNLFNQELANSERKRMRNNLGIQDSDIVFVTVSRLSKEKNVCDVIRLFNLVKKKNENVKLLIVGDGDERGELQELTKSYGLEDSVLFLGEKKREEVWAYYKLGDIYIGASLSETQCLSYIEAMASSLPLLVKYDTILSNYLISGVNGFSFNSDEEFLALSDMLIHSEAKRREIAENARKSSLSFSLDIFGDKLHEVFLKAKEDRNGKKH